MTLAGDILDRAIAGDYMPDFVASRLAYGSFVSIPHRYVYVETPKVASTSLKHAILELEAVQFKGVDAQRPPMRSESRLEMLIHQRNRVNLPSLLDLDPHARRDIFGSNAAWFVFACVRNPYSRLVSFFENKIRLGEPGYAWAEQLYGNPADYAGLRQAFSAYVLNEIADKSHTNGHLQKQTDLILVDLVPYSKIFRMEELAAGLADWHSHLLSRGVQEAGLPRLSRRNGAAHKRNWRDYYDLETANAVARTYESDFKRFDYDPDDWQSQSPAADFEETGREAELRQQIVERNNFIVYLHWLIEGRH